MTSPDLSPVPAPVSSSVVPVSPSVWERLFSRDLLSVKVVRLEGYREGEENAAEFTGPEALRQAEQRLLRWTHTAPNVGCGYHKCNVAIRFESLNPDDPTGVDSYTFRFDLAKSHWTIADRARQGLLTLAWHGHYPSRSVTPPPEAGGVKAWAARVLANVNLVGSTESIPVERTAIQAVLGALVGEANVGSLLLDPVPLTAPEEVQLEVWDEETETVTDACTLQEFLDVNEALDTWQRVALARLQVGESYGEPAGGAASWRVRRVA